MWWILVKQQLLGLALGPQLFTKHPLVKHGKDAVCKKVKMALNPYPRGGQVDRHLPEDRT